MGQICLKFQMRGRKRSQGSSLSVGGGRLGRRGRGHYTAHLGPVLASLEALGAEGVQIGTRFALTQESSASEAFKKLCLNLNEGDTKLLLKKVSPTRLINNALMQQIQEAEHRGASADELREIVGKGKAKLGIFEGDIEHGELEIGQVASLFKGREIETVSQVMQEIVDEYYATRNRLV